MPRGGSRQGAGRLPLAPESKKRVKGFTLSPEVIEQLRLRAKEADWSESYFVESVLRQALGLHESVKDGNSPLQDRGN
ncbi:hypothetical protein [Pseudanabaena sp. PCC 6802]|uniref:hypothetical protein n=1 Tax=Pseudanabaena sp. PCC 6802 TaxID=118173 RepID=UPI00034B824F|nr:hypothetical protein [Pseudanabaena sp. PCC 6802]